MERRRHAVRLYFISPRHPSPFLLAARRRRNGAAPVRPRRRSIPNENRLTRALLIGGGRRDGRPAAWRVRLRDGQLDQLDDGVAGRRPVVHQLDVRYAVPGVVLVDQRPRVQLAVDQLAADVAEERQCRQVARHRPSRRLRRRLCHRVGAAVYHPTVLAGGLHVFSETRCRTNTVKVSNSGARI